MDLEEHQRIVSNMAIQVGQQAIVIAELQAQLAKTQKKEEPPREG